MSKTNRPNHRRAEREAKSRRQQSNRADTPNRANQTRKPEHHITVSGVRRDPPDLRKLSRAVIALAMAEMEAEKAAAEKAAPEEIGDTVDQLKAALPVVVSPPTTADPAAIPTGHDNERDDQEATHAD